MKALIQAMFAGLCNGPSSLYFSMRFTTSSSNKVGALNSAQPWRILCQTHSISSRDFTIHNS
jgi:hypothetical protein